MDYNKVKQSFNTWGPALKPFIESVDMDEIFIYLKKRKSENVKIVPHAVDLFKAFKECPYGDLKCVVVVDGPYGHIVDENYLDDGLALSCAHTDKITNSLNGFYQGIENDIHNNFYLGPFPTDLTFLANQGVLLLNSSLTAEDGNPDAHQPALLDNKPVFLWEKFIRYILNHLNNYHRISFIFIGEKAKRYSDIPVPFHHQVYKLDYPFADTYQDKTWDTQNAFKNINKYLNDNNGLLYTIDWLGNSNNPIF